VVRLSRGGGRLMRRADERIEEIWISRRADRRAPPHARAAAQRDHRLEQRVRPDLDALVHVGRRRVHHGDALSHQPRIALLAQPHQERKDLRLRGHVQCGGRLVRQQQARLRSGGERDHHALAHPAAELVRVGKCTALGVANPDVAQQLKRPRSCLAPAQAEVHAQRLGDLVANPEDGVQGAEWVLIDHPHVVRAQVAQLLRLHPEHIAAVELDLARGDVSGPRDEAYDRPAGEGLAGPGLADQTDDLARPDAQTGVSDGDDPTVRTVELHPKSLDRQQGLRRDSHCTLPRSCPSDRPSPRRPAPTPKRTTTRPGSVATHQAVSSVLWPSAMIDPSSALGGCAPRPR